MSNPASSTAKAGPSRPGSAIKVDADLPKAVPGAPTTRYWIGVTEECPCQNVTAGGINFPLFRGPHVDAGGGVIPLRQRQLGIFAELTDEQMETVRKAVLIRVVRIFGRDGDIAGFEDQPGTRKPAGKRAQILMRDSASYVPQANDVPLGKFLYMHRTDRMGAEAQDAMAWPPETMA